MVLSRLEGRHLFPVWELNQEVRAWFRSTPVGVLDVQQHRLAPHMSMKDLKAPGCWSGWLQTRSSEEENSQIQIHKQCWTTGFQMLLFLGTGVTWSFAGCGRCMTLHPPFLLDFWCVSHSLVSLFSTPWTVAHQASLSMGFSRQEYWSGWPFTPPGDLPNRDRAHVSCIGRRGLYHLSHNILSFFPE